MAEQARVVLDIIQGGRRSRDPPPPNDGDGDGPGSQPVPLSDDQLAQQFSDEVLRDDFLFVAAERKWRVWNGQRWAREETLEAEDKARQLGRRQSQGLEDKRLARAVSGEPTIRRVEKLTRAMRRH